MGAASEPRHLSSAVSELLATRGFARVLGESQLVSIWGEVCGSEVARQTRVLGIKRGVLQIAVANSSLLSELAAFHRASLLDAFCRDHADLKIRDLKFLLRGDIAAA